MHTKKTNNTNKLIQISYHFVLTKIQKLQNLKKKKKKISVPVGVRTRFVTNRNSVEFARKKTQTILFIERGFERLGLSHQTTGFLWCSYMV